MKEVIYTEAMYNICCGLDIHKNIIVACLRLGRKEEIREFGTRTKDIKELVSWLKENDCEMVAMESTSVYWKPFVNIFEIEDVKYMVVNARDFRHVPGRKTDIEDSRWLAQLLIQGMLRASYIPSREQRELREACRYRKKLTEERARGLNRLQKLLEGANIKLSSIVSDIDGKTSLNLLDYVINNEDEIDEAKAKELIITRISASVEKVVEAMDGIVTNFQRLMLREVVAHIKELAVRVRTMDEIIAEYMADYKELIDRLSKIPGIARRSAEIIISEIGVDMERFPTAGHLASWAGVAPGNSESAGKRKNAKTKKSSKVLKSTLAQSAQAAARNKNSFYHAQHQRITVRRGKKRATIAVAHSILTSIYHMIKFNVEFEDLGSDYYNQFNTEKKAESYIRKLENLGYEVVAVKKSA